VHDLGDQRPGDVGQIEGKDQHIAGNRDQRGCARSRPRTATYLQTVIYLPGSLKLFVAIRFEFFSGRLEFAAAGWVLVALSTRLSGLGGKLRCGIGRSRNSRGQRDCDQYCGGCAANKDEGFFCMHFHDEST
jgi:hypothetical protein